MASSAIILQSHHPDDVVVPSAQLDSNEDIQIFLTTSGSDPWIIPLKVCANDTIASVKMRIQACKGYYVKHQRLVYGGRELYRQDALVRDYGLTDGKRVHLVVRFSELQAVTIKTFSGKEHVFRIEKMKSVRDLKKRLSKKAGLDVDQQQLIFRGQDLKDEMLIEQLLLGDDAVVHLFLRNTVKVRSQAIGSEIELSATAETIKETHFHIESPSDIQKLSASSGYYQLNEFHPRKDHVDIEGLSNVQIPSVLNDLMLRVKRGLEHGHAPILSPEGSGGAYFMQNENGSGIVAVFKPVDEEPMALNNPRGLPASTNGEGLKRGTKVGEGALREVAAYVLDHAPKGQNGRSSGFSGVPPTILIQCSTQKYLKRSNHNVVTSENVKTGSLQMFVNASSNCEDLGPALFPVHEVHKIAILDMRLANTDRNGANILACKQGDSAEWTLVPIDHGYCLPEKFEDCTFEWLYWPQAKFPFQVETLDYIASLDADSDIALLEKHGWTLSAACARVLRIGTMLLKKGAAAGLTPYQIGSMMCRKSVNKMSVIKEMVEDATVLTGSSESSFIPVLSGMIDKYIQATVLID